MRITRRCLVVYCSHFDDCPVDAGGQSRELVSGRTCKARRNRTADFRPVVSVPAVRSLRPSTSCCATHPSCFVFPTQRRVFNGVFKLPFVGCLVNVSCSMNDFVEFPHALSHNVHDKRNDGRTIGATRSASNTYRFQKEDYRSARSLQCETYFYVEFLLTWTTESSLSPHKGVGQHVLHTVAIATDQPHNPRVMFD